MGNGKLRLGSSLLLAGVLTLISAAWGFFPRERLSRSRVGRIDLPVSEFLAGDLLFKTGGDALSDLVVQVDGNFSHVGMVVVVGGQTQVVHAVPPGDRIAGVVIESLESYLGDAKRVGWFRVRGVTAPTRQTLQNYALAQVGKPFDLQFSLEDAHALYCSELILRALSEAGIATSTTGVSLAPLSEPVVLPSTLLTANLQPIKIIGY